MGKVGRPRAPAVPGCPFGLSKAERRVLQAVMSHEGYQHAADAACAAPDTIKATMQRVYVKLNVDNRVQAAVKASRAGLLLDTPDREIALTPTEEMVVQQLPNWQGAKTAARDLGLSPASVTEHLGHVYRKLGVNSITQCAVRIERAGFLKDIR